MPTECSRDLFGYEVVEGRQVVAGFDGAQVTSDAGALLLGATNRALGLVRRLARCFTDGRAPELVEHTVETMLMQRICGIALGYEDLVDHDELLGRRNGVGAPFPNPAAKRPGAGDPGRQAHRAAQGLRAARRQEHLEPARACAGRGARALPQDRPRPAGDRAAVRHPVPGGVQPEPIILDLDATDDPLHGHQEGRFFHGYYDGHCYLPLYVFCGRHLLAAKLRRSNIDAAAGATEEIARIVAQIRASWPAVEILLRAGGRSCGGRANGRTWACGG